MKFAQPEFPNNAFIVRSSSGDIDIPVILQGVPELYLDRVYIDSGSGMSRCTLVSGEAMVY